MRWRHFRAQKSKNRNFAVRHNRTLWNSEGREIAFSEKHNKRSRERYKPPLQTLNSSHICESRALKNWIYVQFDIIKFFENCIFLNFLPPQISSIFIIYFELSLQHYKLLRKMFFEIDFFRLLASKILFFIELFLNFFDILFWKKFKIKENFIVSRNPAAAVGSWPYFLLNGAVVLQLCCLHPGLNTCTPVA